MLHYLQCTALHSTTQHSSSLHHTALRSSSMHLTAQHSSSMHLTAQHSFSQHYTALHSSSLHHTALHAIRLFTWPSEFAQEDRERPYKTMERRLAAYRQECEARLQEEVQRQVHTHLCKPALLAQLALAYTTCMPCLHCGWLADVALIQVT